MEVEEDAAIYRRLILFNTGRVLDSDDRCLKTVVSMVEQLSEKRLGKQVKNWRNRRYCPYIVDVSCAIREITINISSFTTLHEEIEKIEYGGREIIPEDIFEVINLYTGRQVSKGGPVIIYVDSVRYVGILKLDGSQSEITFTSINGIERTVNLDVAAKYFDEWDLDSIFANETKPLAFKKDNHVAIWIPGSEPTTFDAIRRGVMSPRANYYTKANVKKVNGYMKFKREGTEKLNAADLYYNAFLVTYQMYGDASIAARLSWAIMRSNKVIVSIKDYAEAIKIAIDQLKDLYAIAAKKISNVNYELETDVDTYLPSESDQEDAAELMILLFTVTHQLGDITAFSLARFIHPLEVERLIKKDLKQLAVFLKITVNPELREIILASPPKDKLSKSQVLAALPTVKTRAVVRDLLWSAGRTRMLSAYMAYYLNIDQIRKIYNGSDDYSEDIIEEILIKSYHRLIDTDVPKPAPINVYYIYAGLTKLREAGLEKVKSVIGEYWFEYFTINGIEEPEVVVGNLFDAYPTSDDIINLFKQPGQLLAELRVIGKFSIQPYISYDEYKQGSITGEVLMDHNANKIVMDHINSLDHRDMTNVVYDVNVHDLPFKHTLVLKNLDQRGVDANVKSTILEQANKWSEDMMHGFKIPIKMDLARLIAISNSKNGGGTKIRTDVTSMSRKESYIRNYDTYDIYLPGSDTKTCFRECLLMMLSTKKNPLGFYVSGYQQNLARYQVSTNTWYRLKWSGNSLMAEKTNGCHTDTAELVKYIDTFIKRTKLDDTSLPGVVAMCEYFGIPWFLNKVDNYDQKDYGIHIYNIDRNEVDWHAIAVFKTKTVRKDLNKPLNDKYGYAGDFNTMLLNPVYKQLYRDWIYANQSLFIDAYSKSCIVAAAQYDTGRDFMIFSFALGTSLLAIASTEDRELVKQVYVIDPFYELTEAQVRYLMRNNNLKPETKNRIEQKEKLKMEEQQERAMIATIDGNLYDTLQAEEQHIADKKRRTRASKKMANVEEIKRLEAENMKAAKEIEANRIANLRLENEVRAKAEANLRYEKKLLESQKIENDKLKRMGKRQRELYLLEKEVQTSNKKKLSIEEQKTEVKGLGDRGIERNINPDAMSRFEEIKQEALARQQCVDEHTLPDDGDQVVHDVVRSLETGPLSDPNENLFVTIPYQESLQRMTELSSALEVNHLQNVFNTGPLQTPAVDFGSRVVHPPGLSRKFAEVKSRKNDEDTEQSDSESHDSRGATALIDRIGTIMKPKKFKQTFVGTSSVDSSVEIASSWYIEEGKVVGAKLTTIVSANLLDILRNRYPFTTMPKEKGERTIMYWHAVVVQILYVEAYNQIKSSGSRMLPFYKDRRLSAQLERDGFEIDEHVINNYPNGTHHDLGNVVHYDIEQLNVLHDHLIIPYLNVSEVGEKSFGTLEKWVKNSTLKTAYILAYDYPKKAGVYNMYDADGRIQVISRGPDSETTLIRDSEVVRVNTSLKLPYGFSQHTNNGVTYTRIYDLPLGPSIKACLVKMSITDEKISKSVLYRVIKPYYNTYDLLTIPVTSGAFSAQLYDRYATLLRNWFSKNNGTAALVIAGDRSAIMSAISYASIMADIGTNQHLTLYDEAVSLTRYVANEIYDCATLEEDKPKVLSTISKVKLMVSNFRKLVYRRTTGKGFRNWLKITALNVGLHTFGALVGHKLINAAKIPIQNRAVRFLAKGIMHGALSYVTLKTFQYSTDYICDDAVDTYAKEFPCNVCRGMSLGCSSCGIYGPTRVNGIVNTGYKVLVATALLGILAGFWLNQKQKDAIIKTTTGVVEKIPKQIIRAAKVTSALVEVSSDVLLAAGVAVTGFGYLDDDQTMMGYGVAMIGTGTIMKFPRDIKEVLVAAYKTTTDPNPPFNVPDRAAVKETFVAAYNRLSEKKTHVGRLDAIESENLRLGYLHKTLVTREELMKMNMDGETLAAPLNTNKVSQLLERDMVDKCINMAEHELHPNFDNVKQLGEFLTRLPYWQIHYTSTALVNKCWNLTPSYSAVHPSSTMWSLFCRQSNCPVKCDIDYTKQLLSHFPIDLGMWAKAQELTGPVNFEEYIEQHVEPKNKTLYKKGLANFKATSQLRTVYRMFQKSKEVAFKSRRNLRAERDNKPRCICLPSYEIRSVCGATVHTLNKTMKTYLQMERYEMYRKGLIGAHLLDCGWLQGETPESFVAMLRRVISGFHDPVFINLDNFQHDSSQDAELMKLIDCVYLSNIGPSLAAADITKEQVLKIMKFLSSVDNKIRLELSSKELGFKKAFTICLVVLKLSGTVFSGDPAKTSWGNTTRMYRIMTALAIKHGYVRHYWSAHAGDDSMHMIERRSLSLFREAIAEAFATMDDIDNLDIEAVPLIKGVGMIIKEINVNDKSCIFTSRIITLVQSDFTLMRIPHRMINTAVITDTIERKIFTEAEFNSVITDQLANHAKGDPNLMKIAVTRIMRLPHTFLSSRLAAKYASHSNAAHIYLHGIANGEDISLGNRDVGYELLRVNAPPELILEHWHEGKLNS